MGTLRQSIDLAMADVKAGRLRSAESICNELLEEHPDDADALHLHGLIAHEKGDHKNSVDRIRRAIELELSLAVWHLNLGIVMLASGLINDAITALRRAIALESHLAKAYDNLGNALWQQG